ncbi:TlpA family protein disulfide reductase [Brackiella oedipodis]|uniref:TlpA family protein disulfide reductase n=1 Tax=Brackiella oedipodis TaxID=124225 RepID=UPI0004916B80|nr:TlpA disulfide reductase family protein [Brackiella oedipodis]
MFKLIKFLLITALLGLSLSACHNREPAPQAQFTSINGQTFTTKDLQGHVTLVEFWATSCVTCNKKMPQLVKIYHKYHDQGYNQVAVAMAYDQTDKIHNYVQKNQLPFTVVHDDGSIAKAFDNVRYTPVAYLLDRQGNIVKRLIGDYDDAEFESLLQQTLQQS